MYILKLERCFGLALSKVFDHGVCYGTFLKKHCVDPEYDGTFWKTLRCRGLEGSGRVYFILTRPQKNLMSRIWIKSSIRNLFLHIVLASLKSLSVRLSHWSFVPCANQHKISPRRRRQFLIRIKASCNPLFGYCFSCLFWEI